MRHATFALQRALARALRGVRWRIASKGSDQDLRRRLRAHYLRRLRQGNR